MRAWTAPDVPTPLVTAPPVRLHDTATGGPVELVPQADAARLYVCGITPYDATHMGHAATYVAFDLLNRAWRSAGHAVRFVQNVTDVDDPLLERATKVGIDWVALAERETELFRTDMEALRVLPPDAYVGAVESIPLVIALIERLQEAGAVYRVDDDLYFSVAADADFGSESGYSRELMLEIFPERGGDPERPGKKDPLDALLWRAERPGEPSWDSPFGPGRPGWHVECAAIALEHLGTTFDVQGGGSDLVFPHHEMCAGHVQVAEGAPFARAYAHAGMVAYDGEKMSKSKGNLVFVSALRASEVDPMAIRATLLSHHYRSDWEWTDADLFANVDRIALWRRALALGAGAPAAPVVDGVLAALAADLDAPRALALVDQWAHATVGGPAIADTSDPDAAVTIHRVLDSALGLAL
ncbi:cysteine--1-D-myo-inosityl 2-amino-2-deoxy-alpha-D-glucopyranoside ligase [Nocardioides sp. GY 10127]|uniref:cysteine--1-D-myo-inosityl 2-amino-2-deoxy-alpha-D-glucopyranoside ligase n=1 Tax=Nocardioides sp. GY 10127 TaxID=2569762 RepID=UPI0010A7F47A|nr:cysteine--1-D-myo-inosityl 2-amino-2-deoxy-alpha-D-glucopyranoside ligase [Nocardioides sp. GY 10127]TIC86495.1 cysteine--1-D-myo-inosityl 2-amino-2-deoxy-alpha-D-glucopyranoside ligase [Nocardioides sp. GY 10127]